MNKEVKLELSTGEKINFNLGYKNNSIICDFMNCEYNCNPTSTIDESSINEILIHKGLYYYEFR